MCGEVIARSGGISLAAHAPGCASLAPMLSRRSLLGGLSAAAAVSLLGRPGRASVARAVSLSELVHRSEHAVLVTPRTISSQWETVGRRRRIVSYTVLQVDGALDGRSPDSGEMVVRTLGGRVGDIGQVVHGEAVFRHGLASAMFLEKIEAELYSVTAMAQGHYPLHADDRGTVRLHKSPRVAELLQYSEAAVQKLHTRTIVESQQLILQELHPHAR